MSNADFDANFVCESLNIFFEQIMPGAIATIQADIAQLQHISSLRQQQNLYKQFFDFNQKLLAKVDNGDMIWMQTSSNVTKRNAFMGRFFDLVRTEYSYSISVEQQPQKNFWRDCFSANGCIFLIDLAQIKLGDYIDADGN